MMIILWLQQFGVLAGKRHIQMSVLCLRAWLREMLSLVRGEALSVEGTDLEQLIKKHEEYRVQIDRQLSKSQAVKEEGRSLIEEGNFMSQEVNPRI